MDFWESHGFFQGAVTKLAMDTLDSYPESLCVTYEHLCANPMGAFKELADYAGIPWSEALENKVVSSTESRKTKTADPANPYSTSRLSVDMIDKWRERLEDKQVIRIRSGYDRFGAPFYGASDW